MTREETKKCIEVMQAYVDGKEIEVLEYYSHTWIDCVPKWDFQDFFNRYRIKEAPKPFDWRGKNIQWVRLIWPSDAYVNTTLRVQQLGDEGFYYGEGNLVPWNSKTLSAWEWSEDNATWRKFE